MRHGMIKRGKCKAVTSGELPEPDGKYSAPKQILGAETRSAINNTPRRIQHNSTKGWQMPPNTVYVRRPTKWVNPFWLTSRHIVEFTASVDHCRRWLAGEAELGADPTKGLALAAAAKKELRSKNLDWWYALDQLCLADVTLDLANIDPLGEEEA